jgi:hypothetical protein
VALPEMRRLNYSGRLATASLAAGGTLGILLRYPAAEGEAAARLRTRTVRLAGVSETVTPAPIAFIGAGNYAGQEDQKHGCQVKPDGFLPPSQLPALRHRVRLCGFAGKANGRRGASVAALVARSAARIVADDLRLLVTLSGQHHAVEVLAAHANLATR